VYRIPGALLFGRARRETSLIAFFTDSNS